MRPEDEDFRDAIAREGRQARAAAKAFAQSCQDGNVERFYEAVDLLNISVDAWRIAMRRVARLAAVDAAIRSAFLPVWIETKMLPLHVGDRRTLANGLSLLLPCSYQGGPMHLYRGAAALERRRKLYGFSWTSRLDVARGFAGRWRSSDGGGVVLQTLAPPEAILPVREVEGYYDEGEVVADPFKLGKVAVVERAKQSPQG